MLYLPPGWGHEGVAEGECLTCSIGFRAAGREQLGRDVLQRALDAAEPIDVDPLYRDPKQPATDAPGRIPPALQAFAADAVTRLLAAPQWLGCALGEVLSEPKPGVWFESATGAAGRASAAGVTLDKRSRMLYDDWHVFLNGESFRAAGRDATMMRRLADRRALSAGDLTALSSPARELLDDWVAAGWILHTEADAT